MYFGSEVCSRWCMNAAVNWDAQPPDRLWPLFFSGILATVSFFQSEANFLYDWMWDEGLPYVCDRPKTNSSVASAQPVLLPGPAILLKLPLLTAFPWAVMGPPSR